MIGYPRIHENDTETVAQEALLGTLEALFIDAASCMNGSQPQLNAMLTVSRRGDVIRVATIGCLGTTLADAIDMLTLLTGMGLEVQFGDRS